MTATQTHRTELCPDVLEAAPPTAGLAHVLALASYYLAPDGTKTGSLGLLRAAGGSSPITPLCSAPAAAVFDARWAPHPAGDATAPALLMSATHGGCVGLHLASGGGGGCGGAPSLAPLGGWALGGGAGGAELSALCCEWLERDAGSGGARAAAGLSDGRLWAGALRGGGGGAEGDSWAAHSLRGTPSEVWCAAAKPEPAGARRTVLWSGGDDGVLRGWDLRAQGGGGGGGSGGATFASRAGAFGGGVTCISWAPWGGWEHVAAVGSYDGKLRLWDDRRVGGAAEPLAALPLGGGVWRVKWRDGGGGGGGWRAGRALAVAAMYGGARVVALDGGAAAAPLPAAALAYTGHGEGSITYGVEWVGEGADAAVATCAFYEREVHVWA